MYVVLYTSNHYPKSAANNSPWYSDVADKFPDCELTPDILTQEKKDTPPILNVD